MSNTLFNNIKTDSPTPLYRNYYTFSARIDVNSNFIICTKSLNLVPKLPKSPNRVKGIPPPTPSPLVSITLLNNRNGFPPPPTLYAVKAQTSLAPLSRFRGSHITTAHEQQCCRFQSYAKTVPSPMKLTSEIDKAWTTFLGSATTDHGLITSDL